MPSGAPDGLRIPVPILADLVVVPRHCREALALVSPVALPGPDGTFPDENPMVDIMVLLSAVCLIYRLRLAGVAAGAGELDATTVSAQLVQCRIR
jgi:hypothetical protein